MAEFNTAQFNEKQFNADAFLFVKDLSDSISIADAAVIKDLLRTLADSITISEGRTVSLEKPLNDSIFSSDAVTKQITEKILQDTVQLAAWLTKKRQNSANWSD